MDFSPSSAGWDKSFHCSVTQFPHLDNGATDPSLLCKRCWELRMKRTRLLLLFQQWSRRVQRPVMPPASLNSILRLWVPQVNLTMSIKKDVLRLLLWFTNISQSDSVTSTGFASHSTSSLINQVNYTVNEAYFLKHGPTLPASLGAAWFNLPPCRSRSVLFAPMVTCLPPT